MDAETAQRSEPEYDGFLLDCPECNYLRYQDRNEVVVDHDCPDCGSDLDTQMLYTKNSVRDFLKQLRDRIIGCEHAADEYHTHGTRAVCSQCRNTADISQLSAVEEIESVRGV